MPPTYFEDEIPELVERLEGHFVRVRESYEEKGWQGALVLGGGYGRGEGGVMRTGGEVGFSNDLDYFFFHDDPHSKELMEWCRRVEREESAVLGIDVEIKTLRADSVGDPSVSMMFADLVAGHVVVAGEGGFLREMREGLDFRRIEAAEATRLLWNRGSGLFFSRCRIDGRREKGFVIRNHAKLKLALGDAWLCLRGEYTPRCRERGERLRGGALPEGIPEILEWHGEGVRFKFEPYAEGPTWEDLEEESERLVKAWGVVYLAAEELRLGGKFSGFGEYLGLSRILPATPVLKNLLLAARDRMKRGGMLRPPFDYPRAALMRALPCLLGLTGGGASEAGRFLPAPAGDVARRENWEPVYARWWGHYA